MVQEMDFFPGLSTKIIMLAKSLYRKTPSLDFTLLQTTTIPNFSKIHLSSSLKGGKMREGITSPHMLYVDFQGVPESALENILLT